MATTEYINKIKTSLRISIDDFAINANINDLILSAQKDLTLAGVLSTKAEDESDSLIRQAVTTYCRAHWGLENADMDKYIESFLKLKKHLLMSEEYTTEEA